MRNIKTYSELVKLASFEERFNYLKIQGKIGIETFGFDRYLNQTFYNSREWKRVRNLVIARDLGCDLGIPDYPINDRIYIHHMNPVTIEDVIAHDPKILNPEYLICVSRKTHEAIHYGSNEVPRKELVERSQNDTCPWK